MEQMKDRLKLFRKKLGLKQRDVAERLEMNVGTVGSWECGSEKVPKTRIYQLCKEYNLSRKWLETGVGEMFEKPTELAQREQIARMFELLSSRYKELLFDVASAVVEANGDTDAAINAVDTAIKKYLEGDK